jgi:hypothetical protein
MGGFEKRRSKRLNIDLTLNISNLFKQDNVTISGINEPIHVINISKGGIGFKTTATLPIGYYFNAKIKLGDDESVLYTVVRILRSELLADEECKLYGAEFVGRADILDYIFDDYETSLESNTTDK